MSEEIFSSTGEEGTSVRQDGRLYHNAQEFYMGDVDRILDVWQELEAKAASMPEISRIVLRAITDESVAQELAQSQGAPNLEVALNLSEHNDAGWLVYLGQNAEDRPPLTPYKTMIEATDETVNDMHPPELNTDYEYARVVGDDIALTLYSLWSETFGWGEDAFDALVRRVDQQHIISPIDRSVWFSSIVIENRLAAAAMAERIDLPSRVGRISLVESTEWRTHKEHLGERLMPRVLIDLNQQIAADTASYQIPPVVYAECNFTSRSDKAGQRAGFCIPDRELATQIVPQNVTVNDGILPKGLRDFTFMHLPVSVLESLR